MRMNVDSIPTAIPTHSGPTLLIVDDEAEMRRALKRTLDEEPYRILQADDAKSALAILAREPVHVILSDHNMPGMSGLDLLRTIALRFPSVVRMMVTATHEFDVAVRAINLGEVSRFITKPWDDEELVCSVRAAFAHAALEREVRILRRQAKRNVAVLHELEARFPGISHVKRDRGGAVVLSELDDDGRVSDAALWSDDERGA
jgi:DNA-binding NtrC family response regulator